MSLDRAQVISWLDRTLPLWAFVLCLVSGGIAATNPSMVEFDAEEAVNASQALALLAGHGGMEFLRLQYATCCGGCLDSVKAIIRSESGRAQNRSDSTDIVRLPVVSS